MMQNELASFAKSAGIDAETTAALQEDAKSAVTAALEEAQGSGHPKEAIQSVVQGVLDEYGLDSEAFMSQMEEARAAPRPTGMMGGRQMGGNTLAQMLGSESGQSDISSFLASLDISLADYLG